MALHRRIISALLLLLLVNGCHSCSSSGDIDVDDDDDFEIDLGVPLYNGPTCETADSFWACRSSHANDLDFAVYLATQDGVAVTRSPGAEAVVDAFAFSRRGSTSDPGFLITTRGGRQIDATQIDGSTPEKFLAFRLDGGGFEGEDFSCVLEEGEVLDADCDRIIDVFEGTPTATRTRTATATHTPTPTATPSTSESPESGQALPPPLPALEPGP